MPERIVVKINEEPKIFHVVKDGDFYKVVTSAGEYYPQTLSSEKEVFAFGYFQIVKDECTNKSIVFAVKPDKTDARKLGEFMEKL